MGSRSGHFVAIRCEEPHTQYASRVMEESSEPATIMVVDDETALLRLLARVLKKAGHTVITAVDGDEAISVFEKNLDRIDAVILDVNIPPNGIYDVMVHILELRSDLALVLSSGDILDEKLRTKLESHGGTFLRKPFVPRTLLSVVSANLEARRKVAEAGDGEST